MLIKDLFAKNLFRPINGVVKAEQQEDAVVWQELEEYVLTKELDQHFRKFFDAYQAARRNAHDPSLSDRMGIWVSGFFGSGKSHFIKILSYLLNNREACNPQTSEYRRAAKFFEEKIKDPLLLADIKNATNGNTDVILFNIDSRADAQDGRGTILSVFWRVFNEMQGFCGEYPHLAEMERYLTSKGKFEEFCTTYSELSGEDWIKERDAFHFKKDEVVEALSKTLGQSLTSTESWFDKSENSVSLTIDAFAKRVKEYLDSRGKDHRIVFLVDEVGQFIGNDTHLMLNLQTITEDLGRVCQGRAWVVVTSQEDIDAILDLVSLKANDFSKIQGRFRTRLSLSSSNTDEVIQIRLLEKKSAAQEELQRLFDVKGDIINSQLGFSHDSAHLKTYRDRVDFAGCYPFAPYHFQLVQKIFESIRKAGATGLHLSRGERSMLDAFQSAAINVASKDIGALVPLYEFYPSIESFLDTAVKRTIEQASGNDGLEKPFDIQLLKTLFLIRYVDIIKPNVENLVTLFVDQVDSDRLSLKRRIEAGLQRLEKETLITRNGDLFFFLTNEEQTVRRQIKNIDITGSEELKLLSEIIFAEIFKDQSKFKYRPYKRDYAFVRLLDGHPYSSKVDQDIAVEIISPLNDQYALFNSMKCILYSGEHLGRIVFKLPDQKELGIEVRDYLQTDKFIRLNSDASQTVEFKKILRELQEENRERRTRLTVLIENLLCQAKVYVLQQELQLKNSGAKGALDEALEYVIQNVFLKFSYLEVVHDDPIKELRAVLLSNDVARTQLQMDLPQVNAQAIKELREHVDLLTAKNHTILLADMVTKFSAKPYGWPEWEVVLLAARLFMAGEIKLVVDDPLEPRQALDVLTKTTQWRAVRIMKCKLASPEEIEKARKLCQDLFGKIGPESGEALVAHFKEQLQTWRRQLGQFRPLAQTGQYPGASIIDRALGVIEGILTIRDSYECIIAFNRKKNDLLDAGDDIHELSGFYANQKPTWDKLRQSLRIFNTNAAALNKNADAAQALKRLQEIAAHDSPYGMIKDVEGYILKVATVNERMICDIKKVVRTDLEAKIQIIDSLLDKMNATIDVHNQILDPLQVLLKTIEEEQSIPSLSYIREESEKLLEEAIIKIDDIKSKDNNHTISTKTKFIDLKLITNKVYLESVEDIDNLITELKDKLLSELNNNTRIRVK
ncbi:hypothetical protein SAMN04488082_11566 [Desulfomicrobium apsheronum]|uniref:BREX system P-loop protein BrxC n=1 Tax=Desulfomicrobium apsheronum TaxID=52560 RepID=A0A1I3X624_9BACT|nr:BREX system P-loop protein BrxC [Desulfomicrobium apsheronum]SFK15020.1 hypothetical protein SAMN04488082_11566 [Desulfomicrobium apsheronum]